MASITIPRLNPPYAEEHPLLAPIIAKRARPAGDFSPAFSGHRGQDFDRGLLCALEAANGALQWITAEQDARPTNAPTAVNAGEGGYVDAFYEIAGMLGVGARPSSPKEVWEQEMRPALLASLCPPQKSHALKGVGRCVRRVRRYVTPVEWDRTITAKLKLVSPIRAEAQVQQISTIGFSKVFNDRAVGSGWVGETASRPATTNLR